MEASAGPVSPQGMRGPCLTLSQGPREAGPEPHTAKKPVDVRPFLGPRV